MEGEIDCSLSTIDSMTSRSMVQRQITDASYIRIDPTSSVKNSDVIEFIIHSKDDYFDLHQTELEVKFRIKKADGSNLGAGDKVSIINYPVASLFSNVQVMLNNKEISHGGANYAVRSYLETVLSYGVDASKGWLQAGLFHKDTAGQMDNGDPTLGDGAVNDGLKERAAYTNQSALAIARGKLHLDMFHQGKPLINNLEMKLRFFKNNDKFCVMATDNAEAYKVHIEDMALFVRQQKVSPEMIKSVSQQSDSDIKANYQISRVIMKEFQITSGGKSKSINQFHKGILPTKVVLAFTKNDAMVGDYALNPFNFKNYDLSELSLRVNGHELDGTTLKLDYDSNQFLDGYWSLFRATDKKYRDESMMIEKKDYKNGYAIYGFDLTPSLCDDQYKDPKKDGRIDLNFTFSKNIPEVVSLYTYLQFDSEIVVNQAGIVTPLFEV